MLSLLDSENHTRTVETHLREMRQEAARLRLARQGRRERPRSRRGVRRHVGGLLIAAGQALAR